MKFQQNSLPKNLKIILKNLHGYAAGVLQPFQIRGSGIPASGRGGQQFGEGEQGTGDGAP